MTIEDIYDMAFAELGLNEDEFYNLPPFRTTLMQIKYRRTIERQWEQTRALMMMTHNVSPNVRRQLRPREIVDLSFDHKDKLPEWLQDDAIDLIRKWGGTN